MRIKARADLCTANGSPLPETERCAARQGHNLSYREEREPEDSDPASVALIGIELSMGVH
jgi:hypothetical protein